MSGPSVRWRGIARAAVVAAATVAIVPAAFGTASAAKSTSYGAVTTASASIASVRLAPTLQSLAAESSGSSLLDVLVMQQPGTGRPSAMSVAVRVRLKDDPAHEFWAGKVRADRLVKLTTASGVEYVADNGRRTPPPSPDTTGPTPAQRLAAGAAGAAKLAAATRAGVVARSVLGVSAGVLATAPAGQPTDWFDVGAVHKSAAAWANGFTGSGVRVAVADDGLDFGHPDLQGTEATVTDSRSPYYGWPMAFDPFSTYAYVLDRETGSDYVARGGTWFSDTSAVVRSSAPTFDHVRYKLPGRSKSGVYHIGHLWDQNLETYWYPGEFPALLVSDEAKAGVYDTVYVDLNDNHDFTDDKRLTKQSPISSLDFVRADGRPGTDGVADLSGGMLYWISDGAHQPPFADQEFDMTGVSAPKNGTLVCMLGAYDLDSDHGTLCASNVAGQGKTDGASTSGEHPTFKPAGSGGMVQGGGRDAKLVGISDIYTDYELSTLMAYDYAAYGLDGKPNTGDEIQVVSNSYGESATDNDEWDFPSRYVTKLNNGDAPTTSFVFATGNGGPGYGTSTAPAPSSGIKVGASTLFGSDGGWDSIASTSQVTFGDVAPFSDRGPTAMGHVSPVVVADGAYAAGSEALSLAGGNGWDAWEVWGGTSRSTPVACGNLALVYQAYRAKHLRWPTWSQARDLLANGATDLDNDTLTQGSGMVDADRSTRLAAGLANGGVTVSPSSWPPGGYHGLQEPAFEQVLHPGDDATGSLTVTNPSTRTVGVTVADSWMQRVRTRTVTLTIDPTGMSAYDFNRPDVLLDVSNMLEPGDQLMVVRAVMPFSEFDPDGDGVSENRIRLLTYDWTDANGNGRLWTDTNGNGVVNAGEIDPEEYERFTYCNADGPSLENRVRDPLGRMHDGVFVGIQHQVRSGAPIHVTLEISFWRRADMPWLAESPDSFTLAGGESRSVAVDCSVPASAPLGSYEGEYRVSGDGTTSVVPVVMTVAGSSANIAYGGAASFEQLMDGSRVFGFGDWGWRAESGDWRFFDTDVPASEVASGSLWLAHTSWVTTPTDIDTLLYGPGAAPVADPLVGPYDLVLKGGSPNTNTGDGVWTFDTATGGAQDWVTGPLSAGLNKLMLHDVVYAGASVGETFTGEAGVLDAAPAGMSFEDTDVAHAATITLHSSMALPGFDAVGYGLSRVVTLRGTARQGLDYAHEFDVSHAAYVDVATTNQTSDIDLYLEKLVGSSWVRVAASETSSGNEHIRVLSPADGHYRARVFGFAVTGGTDPFGLAITVPEGDGITVTGLPGSPVAAGTTVTLGVAFAPDRSTLDERDGKLVGVVAVGPTGASRALQVPVSLTYPLLVEETSPAAGAVDASAALPVTVAFSRRIDPSTLDRSFYLVDSGGAVLRGTVTYNDTAATATLSAPMVPGETYRAVLVGGIATVDGTVLAPYSWTFASPNLAVATSVWLEAPASMAYRTRTTLIVHSQRETTDTTYADGAAPVALQFRASGASTWTTASTGVTDLSGVWRATVSASTAGAWRAVRVRSWSGYASSSDTHAVAIAWAPTLRASTTSTRRGRSIRLTLAVKPSSASHGRSARLERWTGSRWVLDRYVRLGSSGTATMWESRRKASRVEFRLVLTSGRGYATGRSPVLRLRWR